MKKEEKGIKTVVSIKMMFEDGEIRGGLDIGDAIEMIQNYNEYAIEFNMIQEQLLQNL